MKLTVQIGFCSTRTVIWKVLVIGDNIAMISCETKNILIF